MSYVGIQTQQRRNNMRSTILLLFFPVLILVLSYVAYWFVYASHFEMGFFNTNILLDFSVNVAPWVIGGVGIWFLIAYWSNTTIINNAVHSKPLERKENMRVYNLVENLCMQTGMKMPKVNVIHDNSLNAFASGINEKTYTVTLTDGIIQKLNDEELKGVIAHELMHIRNRDVRVLIVSIIFVGVFTMVSQMGLRMMLFAPRGGGNSKNNGGQAAIMLIVVLVSIVGYFCAILMRFAISRKREYMADAGAAEMTKNPHALASALRKISGNPDMAGVSRDDIAQLFIEHPLNKKKTFMSDLFATHPPIQKRIAVLENF
ncbi:MAG: M48 family metallopeptidase [Bacteroidales bacterium]|jgi:heat shock protein HtpX|nr:M48 family metallopeptidase [Bacteroidales bacterium]